MRVHVLDVVSTQRSESVSWADQQFHIPSKGRLKPQIRNERDMKGKKAKITII